MAKKWWYETSEVVDRDLATFWDEDFHGNCTMDEGSVESLRKWLNKEVKKAKKKKIFKELWFELRHVEVDEFGHMKSQLVLRGKSPETKAERKRRMEHFMAQEWMEFEKAERMMKLYKTPDGKAHFKKLKEWAERKMKK